MMKKNLFLMLLLIMILSGCMKQKPITFDNDDPLALTTGIEWAVISDPYAAFRKEAGFENVVVKEGRRAEIYMVKGKALEKTGEGKRAEYRVWYKFEKGWLDESVIELYDNKYKAMTAAEKMK